MADKQETIEDIIAEMRKPHDEICAKCHDEPNESCPYCGDPNGCNSLEYGQWPGVMTQLANRLEAALKREKAAIEADALVVGGIVGVASEKSSPVGDVARLREAFEALMPEIGDYSADGLEVVWCGIRGETIRKVRDALAAPPRNCDVGTPKEQEDRFRRYCNSRCTFCWDCPLYKNRHVECRFAWAQMPYEEGGAK